MIIENVGRYLLNIDNFHRFAFFLGTPSGELLKRFIEFVFYSMILYMILSEFRRNKKREYKYLIVGFFALALRQAFMSTVLFTKVFSIYSFNRFFVFIRFIDHFLEILALLLLVAAFIFPAFKRSTRKFQKFILIGIYSITIITFFTYLSLKYGLLNEGVETIILHIMHIGVLITPFFILGLGDYKKIKYLKSVLLAFFIYLLIPLISLTSLILYGTVDARLVVLQHPLPFISILLLMRTVYLTLVDKAFLQTKLRKSEKDLQREKEVSKLKDHFISIVSHELRTPITSIKLYLSLFRKGKFGRLNKKQDNALKILMDENNRLSDLIDNLLTINKIEANKLILDKSYFNILELIDGLYINIAENKGINIVKRIKNFKVYGDKNRLKQVYINLMNNAIKFSDKNSTITISSGKTKKEWFLSVKDTGIGIPKEELPKLYDKFYQVDNTLTRRNQGIGMGLAIVKNIVDLHDGRIEVNSKPAEGAEFKVWIPLRK